MNFIVFDLEWNTATPGKNQVAGYRRKLFAEITEIGACRLDQRGNHLDELFLTVKPKIFKHLNPYIANVTRQNMTELKELGEPFPEAIRQFMAWISGPAVFCSWSDSDFKPLQENLEFYEIVAPLPNRCIDVQYLFHRLVDQGHRQRSLVHAVDFFSIAKERSFHNAVDDAYYTGRVLEKLLEVAETKDINLETLLHKFSWNPNLEYSHKESLPFERSPKAIPAKLSGQAVICPACRRELIPKGQIGWKKKKKHYVATAICPEHGQVTGRVSYGRLNGVVPELHFSYWLKKYDQ